MACGTPVIASRTPALAEIAGSSRHAGGPDGRGSDHGRAGTAAGKRGGTPQSHAAGLQRAALYPWSAAAKQMLGLYESLA